MAVDWRYGSARNLWVIVLVALGIFLLHHLQLIQFQEDHALDLRLLLQGRTAAHSDIVLVEIDDQSLESIGQWPWKARTHATMVEILADYEPRLILYDVFFGQPSTDPKQDKELGRTLEKAGNVILPFFFNPKYTDRVLLPVQPIQDSALATGYSQISPDTDGHVRRMRPWIQLAEERYYHMAVLAMLNQYRDEEKARNWLKGLPGSEDGRVFIHYPGPLEAFKSISFDDVLERHGTEREEELKELFGNRIVLVGMVAAGRAGARPVPFTPGMSRLAIDASALHTFLTGHYLREVAWGWHLVILVLLALLVRWVIERYQPRNGLFLTLLAGVLYFAGNLGVFIWTGWILPLFVPLVCIGVSYITMLFLDVIDVSVQRDLLDQQLQTASRIQEAFLPQKKPAYPGLDLAFFHRYVGKVGGDFYDWHDFGDECYGFCLGDVSGKGVPAAIYMVRALSEFRRENRLRVQPSEVFEALNRILALDAPPGMFLTMVYIQIDLKRNVMSFTSAGHDPLIYFSHSDRKAEIVNPPKGPPLGIFTDAIYESRELAIHQGDQLLMLSDGVTELRSPKGHLFGIERLRSLVEHQAGKGSAQATIDHLLEAMKTHRRGFAPHDDHTLVCLQMGKVF